MVKHYLFIFIGLMIHSFLPGQNLVINGNFEEYNCWHPDPHGRTCMDSWNYNGQGKYLYPEHLMDKACYTHSGQHYVKFPEECNGSRPEYGPYDPSIYGVVPPKSGDYYFFIPYSAMVDGELRNLDIDVVDLMGRLSGPLKKDRYYYVSYSLALFPRGQYTTDNIEVLMGYRDTLFYDNMTSAIDESTVAYAHPKGDYILNFDEWRTLDNCFQANGGEEYIYFNLMHPQNDEYFKIPNHPGINPTVSPPIKMMYDYFIDDIRLIPLNTNEKVAMSFTYCSDSSFIFQDSLLGVNDVLLHSAQSVYWSDDVSGIKRTFPSSGEYILTVQLDCAEKQFAVNITQEDCKEKVYIPNAFTPNGDGVNDVFNYSLENVHFVSCRIFDRYGGLIYETQNPYLPWDGRGKNDDLVNTGVFVYQLQYRDRQGDIQVKTGTVTVLP